MKSVLFVPEFHFNIFPNSNRFFVDSIFSIGIFQIRILSSRISNIRLYQYISMCIKTETKPFTQNAYLLHFLEGLISLLHSHLTREQKAISNSC